VHVPNLDASALDLADPQRLVGTSRPNAGIVTYPPQARLGPRLQHDCQLVAVHSGVVRVAVDGTGREIAAGHVGLLLPDATELFTFGQGQQTTRHSWIALPSAYLDPGQMLALERAPRCLPLSAAMVACIEAGCEVARLDDPRQPDILGAMAMAALHLYLAEARHAGAHGGPDCTVVARAQAIVRQRAEDGLTVTELAEAVAVSPEHLVRLFRRDLGTTPGTVLRAARLARALQLLTQTGLSVTEVAHQAGYASSQHFARSVREATGRTATELRRRSWSGAGAGLQLKPDGR